MFSRSRPDRDDRALRHRRCDRLDFWAAIAGLVVLDIVLSPMLGARVWASSLGVMLMCAQGRLRDFGRPGRWAVLLPIGFILSFFLVIRNPLMLGLDISLMAFSTLIFVIYVGSTPGDAGANAFGPPPRGAIRSMLNRRAARRAVGS